MCSAIRLASACNAFQGSMASTAARVVDRVHGNPDRPQVVRAGQHPREQLDPHALEHPPAPPTDGGVPLQTVDGLP
jgi:hypothetical protein